MELKTGHIVVSVSLTLLAVQGCFTLLNNDWERGGGHAAGFDSFLGRSRGRVLSSQVTAQQYLDQLADERSYPRLDTRRNYDDIMRPRARCDRRIRVLNGATRIRDKGSLVRFQCSYGYQ
jgi:hypothetical protein